MQFSILGAVEVRIDGLVPAVGGLKQRALLAMLLLQANEVVSRDRLIEGLWGERAPPTAQRSLDSYISRLRALLGKERIKRKAPGYLIRIESGELDLDLFEALVEHGRACSRAGDVAGAAQTLRQALAIWRGPALADLLYEPFAAREAERLEERRLLALEERIDAELALGESPELVAELEQLVRQQPFREQLLGLLMRALYRSGRQAEALDAYQSFRRRLADELGLDPGPKLQELQRQILEQHPALARPRVTVPRASRLRRTSRRKLVAAGLAAAAVATSSAIGIVLGTRATGASPLEATSSQIVGLSTSGASGRAANLGGAPAAIAPQGDSLWLADGDSGTVSRFDPASRSVVERITVGGSPSAIAVTGGSVWVAGVLGSKLTRIDPKTETITQSVDLGGAQIAALATGAGGLWAADRTDNALIELDPTTGTVLRTVTLSLRPTALAIGGGVIWVAGSEVNEVAEIDARSGQTVATIGVGNGPAALALENGTLWVANSLDSTVSRIDPASGSVVATIPVGSYPTALVGARGSVWVGNQYSATVSRIDAKHGAVQRTTHLGGSPTALAVAGGTVWVGTRPLGHHHGGTLILLKTHPISIDPALQLDLLPLQSDGLTRDGLIAYDHVGGQQGLQFVPDLAISVPGPTDGGRTYTFRLRPGIRYSDGHLLRAGDFRRELERLFRLRSGGGSYFTGIAGAAACERAPTSCDLSQGVVVDDRARTIAFHLSAADPDFLSKLAIGGLATPVPVGTPFHDTGYRPIPGTGPYKIASASQREIRYVRNPFFHEWSHAAQPNGNPDTIVMRFGLSPAQEVHAIEQGHADWTADGVPAQALPSVLTRFAGEVHAFPNTETDFFQINTTVPPFDDVRVRQALNFAIDRRLIVRLYGGHTAASPTCQVLPPGVPGYEPYCPYTRTPGPGGLWTAPDLARAQRLITASGTRGERITVWGRSDDPVLGRAVVLYTVGLLHRLGYRTQAHLVPSNYFDHAPATIFKRIQLIPPAWVDTTAYNFFATWFTCAAAYNHGWFCEPHLDREIRSAQALEATNPRGAASRWASIDHQIVNQAGWVPLVNVSGIDFVSARIRNYQHNPYWGIIADQLSLR